jgi:hypothetical protein
MKNKRKFALYAFNGDPMCFVHVLLNGIDLAEKGNEVKIVMEGNATALVPELMKDGDTPSHALYKKAKQQGLIAEACRACSHKMGVLQEVEKQQIALRSEMSGHPSFSLDLEDGWEVLTF